SVPRPNWRRPRRYVSSWLIPTCARRNAAVCHLEMAEGIMDGLAVSVASCAALLVLIAGASADVVIGKARPGVAPSLERSPALAAAGVRSIRPTLNFEVANPDLAR